MTVIVYCSVSSITLEAGVSQLRQDAKQNKPINRNHKIVTWLTITWISEENSPHKKSQSTNPDSFVSAWQKKDERYGEIYTGVEKTWFFGTKKK